MLVDLIIAGVTALAVWRGSKRGLLRSLAGFGGTIAGIVGALIVYRSTGSAGGALVALVAVSAGLHTVAHLATRAVRGTMLGRANALAGAAVGGAWALLWLSLAILAMRVAPVENELTRSVQTSTFADAVVSAEASLASRNGLARWLEDLLGGPPSVELRASANLRVLREAEAELLEMANLARSQVGARPLRWDGRLAQAARAHATDLYRSGRFSHLGRDGSTPGARLEALGIDYRVTGENLALAPTAQVAHARLMGSPRHRAHLLDRRFTRVGIAAIFGDQGILVAQEFAR